MKTSLLSILVVITQVAFSQVPIPEHGGYWVHDDANVLSAQIKSRLEIILQAERDSTSNQIAILILPSLKNEALEDFSLRVAEAWKIGKKAKDNGVLLFISIDDRKIRIETGYGLEGSLTDAVASRIIRNEIAPHFRNGDYEGGVESGVMAIMQAIKGEYTNDGPIERKKNSKRSSWTTILIILIIIIIAFRGRRGGGGGHWSAGRGWIGPIGGGLGGSSWGSGGGGGFGGGSFGGGGGFGGGGSSGSW